jgi:hypothetical protein
MALQITLSLPDDVAAELQRSASRAERSLEEEVIASLRSSIPRQKPKSGKPFEIRAKALHARPGVFDDLDEFSA